MLCEICSTDEAVEKHHVVPKSKGGKETIDCCSDCGGQVHMLFTNEDLGKMTLTDLMNTNKMRKYIKWKQKHPGNHRHRMSNEVKRKTSRGYR